MKTAAKILALVAGVALFGWYLSRADLGEVWKALARLGWMAPVALIPYFCVYIVDCVGWRFCLVPGVRVPFLALIRIRWAGESVNNVLPSAYIGGETVKVYLLRKKGVSGKTGATGAVVSKTAQTVAQLILIILASVAFLRIAGDRPGLPFAMLMVICTGALVLAGLFWVQRRGIFNSVLALVSAFRIRPRFVEKYRGRIAEADGAISGFYREHRPRFYASTIFYLCGWLMDTLEIYLVAYLLGMPITWPQALAVEGFTGVAKALGMWVPGSLGIQESGIVMLGRLAGLPDTLSVSYALFRRAREVLFAAAGWLILVAEHTTVKEIKAAGETTEDA